MPTLDDALELFDREIRSVSEDRRNGLVVVSVQWRDPVEAAKWANELVRQANEDLRRRVIADAERNLEFLRLELERTSVVELQEMLYRVIETELRKSMLASVREQYAFRVIDKARPPVLDKPVWPRPVLLLRKHGDIPS